MRDDDHVRYESRCDGNTYDDSKVHGNIDGNVDGDGNAHAASRSRPRLGQDVILLLSVEEAARALRLGRSKTYELIAAGELEVVHIGRCARVPVDAVEAYVERLRAG